MRLTRYPETRFQDESAARYGEVVNRMHASLWRALLVSLYVLDAVLGSAALLAFTRDQPGWLPWFALAVAILSAMGKRMDFGERARVCNERADQFGDLLARRHALSDDDFATALSAVQHRFAGRHFERLRRRAYNRVCDEIGEPGNKYRGLLAW